MRIQFVINQKVSFDKIKSINIFGDFLSFISPFVWQDYIEIVQQLPKAKFLDMFQRKYAHSLTVGFAIYLKEEGICEANFCYSFCSPHVSLQTQDPNKT